MNFEESVHDKDWHKFEYEVTGSIGMWSYNEHLFFGDELYNLFKNRLFDYDLRRLYYLPEWQEDQFLNATVVKLTYHNSLNKCVILPNKPL